MAAAESTPSGVPPIPEGFHVEPAGVVMTSLKPANDGKDWIARIYNASAQPCAARLVNAEGKSINTWQSDLYEVKGERVKEALDMLPYEFATLRVRM